MKRRESNAKIIGFFSLAFLSTCLCSDGRAEDNAGVLTVPDVVVEAPKETVSVIQPPESAIGTKEDIDKSTINIQGGGAQINPYKAISLQPGVDIASKDAWGLNITHRIRGKQDRNIGETIEGLPVKGIGPGVGLGTMIDLENIESISLMKGAVPVESGIGFGSDNGMIDMHMQGPADQFHGTVMETIGSDKFTRTYARVDTGTIDNIAKAFISASYTDGDKWKGEGKAPDGRQNYELGISSPTHRTVEWEFYTIYNYDDEYAYRGLSYDQTQNLSKYYDFDYNPTLTKKSDEDIKYYGYNRSHYETYTFFGKLKANLTENSSIQFKPYYLEDQGFSYSGSSEKVIDWFWNHDTYGATMEYDHKIGKGDIKVGYWHGESEPPGPPTSQKWRSTDGLDFLGWKSLVKVDNHVFDSPYVAGKQTFGSITLDAGVRSLWLTQPDLTSYKTKGLPDVSYSQALSMNPDVDVSVEGKTFDLFLPTIGATYKLFESISLRASYGRNYNTPEYSLGSQIPSFKSSGFTDQQIQEMWDSIKPETADNFDLGLTYKAGKAYISSTLFYGRYYNAGGNFYDPDLKFAYYQNTAEAQSYGAELATGYQLSANFDASLSFTYNRYEFTSDMVGATGKTIHSEGNQIPDVPEYMANLSANWRIERVVITPTLRYLGERYSDVENQYNVDTHFLVDLMISRKFNISGNRSVTVAASVSNLLDETYISTISTANLSIGQNTPTYYAGAPRTFFLSLRTDF